MKALLVVDIQNDFLPGGALAVKRGDEVVAVANRLMPYFDTVIATQDWHPAGHGSFAINHAGKTPGQLVDLNGIQQILWPAHCVQHSEGAEFAPGLKTSEFTKVIAKGTDPGIDSYSAFHDNAHQKNTGLTDYLKSQGISEVFIVGLATDYCVKFTALDAVELGFKTAVVVDGIRGVGLNAGDSEKALEELHKAGVTLIESDTIIRGEGTHA